MSETAVAWLFAGAGWGVVLFLLLVILLARRDWSRLWQNAWDLRREGWTPDPLLGGAAGLGLHQRPRPGLTEMPDGDVRNAGGPTEPVELPADVLNMILQESEAWRREELAEEARRLYQGGATDLHVIAEIRKQISDRR